MCRNVKDSYIITNRSNSTSISAVILKGEERTYAAEYKMVLNILLTV